MKKLLFSILSLSFAIITFAQEKDVTKFLGIPIDGSKNEMITKLKNKGFTQIPYDKEVILEGEFNGTAVEIYISTNNNKVHRIMVCDKNYKNEADIRIRFNKLYCQFIGNSKYITLGGDYPISEDEDISYQMSVNNKRYQAAFYQIDKDFTSKYLLGEYTEEQINNYENLSLENKIKIMEIVEKHCSNKLVWFMISEAYGKYYISMFYDNVLNQANGDDL